MKIKLSKKQWIQAGENAKWIKQTQQTQQTQQSLQTQPQKQTVLITQQERNSLTPLTQTLKKEVGYIAGYIDGGYGLSREDAIKKLNSISQIIQKMLSSLQQTQQTQI